MDNFTPTPHNEAKFGQIAKTVLLPGDALRAKMIAEKFLTDVELVNTVRNNYCFTGFYKGKRVSVMSTGMGCGSMGIYSYELFNFYGVENAIRVGTIGSLNKNYKLKDIIVAEKTISDTNYLKHFEKNGECEIKCSPQLLKHFDSIIKNNKNVKIGKIYTTDTFYNSKEENEREKSLGVVGVEMECAALYLNAQNANKNAICICTVSDEILTNKHSSAEERQTSFCDMIKIALDLAITL